MTRVFIWKNNSPQEWEEISFSAFSKARRNGCFTGRFFVETVKMFRDEDDRIIMECSRKDFEKYQQEDRHSRYLQEHEKSRSISRYCRRMVSRLMALTSATSIPESSMLDGTKSTPSG